MGATSILVMCLLGHADLLDFLPDIGGKRAADRARLSSNLKQLKVPLHQLQERYDPIPFDGNLDAILRRLLQQTDDDQELANLLTQFQGKAKNVADLAKLQARIQDPSLRDFIQKLVRGLGKGTLTADELLKLQDSFKGLIDRGGELPQFTMPDIGAGFTPPEPDIEERFSQWAKDLLKDMDNSRLGEFLRDSPAWQNGLRELERAMRGSEARFDWLRGMPDKWKLPEGWTPKLDGWVPKLGEWTGRAPNLPSLPHLRFSPPNLGRFNVNLGGARFSTPSVSGPSDGMIWVLALLLFALLAWFFYQKLGRLPAAAAALARRGPWPVDPSKVTTRRQLIQAFDYLALLLLGDEVRSWNHVALAKKLGTEAARSPAAGALAQLYEIARYTPGDDLLPPDAQLAARRHLTVLAGSAAA